MEKILFKHYDYLCCQLALRNILKWQASDMKFLYCMY